MRLRQLLTTNEQAARRIEALERKVGKHDVDLGEILAILKKLLQPAPETTRRPIGFVRPEKK